MLRRLKREVMGQLPPKRRQVVRLPPPEQKHWPKDYQQRPEGTETSSLNVRLSSGHLQREVIIVATTCTEEKGYDGHGSDS